MPPRTLMACLALTALFVMACASGPGVPDTSMAEPTPQTFHAAPLIIAHRGGTGDAPENTLVAIHAALANHADAIWLTVQLSRDGVPVLYRPADLSVLTDASGPVASKTASELARVNAGWRFKAKDAAGNEIYPWRNTPVGIPTLEVALAEIPAGMPVILDMKALPAEPQAAAVAKVVTTAHAWDRVRIYSTAAAYQRTFAAWPQARLFESRDATRERLATVALAHKCEAPPPAGTWAAFEFHRQVDLLERFTLGEGRSTVNDATLWSASAVQCFRTHPDVHLVAIAINDAADYKAAACAGVDGVLADSPRRMVPVREVLKGGYSCP
ncbi:glycerophosphodiester phosphodiesterase [Burkholderia ubonensis]|uniref:glycerophosphodiester phosphodiesterase family protein n=1 Tax=Burkholderia ubonensis TaxID=101571 RepID=UPI000752B313|nr:glycerophosphodiester phosphodiesterase family protein [Burkholderia ubonensis]KWB65942.1 glycerophosphodiester phosphodiesterase [Burkholderia ubonensis]